MDYPAGIMIYLGITIKCLKIYIHIFYFVWVYLNQTQQATRAFIPFRYKDEPGCEIQRSPAAYLWVGLRAWSDLFGKRVPRKPSENRKQNKDMDFVLRKLCVGSGYQKE